MTELNVASTTGLTTFTPIITKNSPREGSPSVMVYSSGPNGLRGFSILIPIILGIIKTVPIRMDNIPERPASPSTVIFHNGTTTMLAIERTASEK